MSSAGDYHVVFTNRLLCQGFDFLAYMLYLHCVSEEKFGIKLNDFTCATLKCREAHVSYIECLSERQRCVIPDVVESRSVDVYVFELIFPSFNIGNQRKVS